MKKVNKPLNGSTNWPMKKTIFTFQKCENNWSWKSNFASSQHLAHKIKEDCTKCWNERWHTENDSSSPTFWPLSLSTGLALSKLPAKKNRKVIIDKLSPTTFSSKFMKIQRSFHKTDLTKISNGPRSTKPKNFKTKNDFTRPHAKPQSLNDPQPSSLNLCKAGCNFRTWTILGDSTASDLQHPKILGLSNYPRVAMHRQKIRWWLPSITRANTCLYEISRTLTRW